MKELRHAVALALMGSALALAGCGSGSGGNAAPDAADPTPPVADDPAPPAAQKITVTGTVTDMPIPNATVVLTVNGQAFEAPLPTDAEGNYAVEIESTDPQAMVLCEAHDPNGVARFTALLDNFAGFDERADEDGNVADVDITNVTTAQYILATRLTDDGVIDDMEELEQAASQVQSDDLLEVSAAIKLVVENIGGVALPTGISDTHALAEAIVAGTSNFLSDVEVSNPGALAQAQELVLTDGNATGSWATEDVSGVYFSTDGDAMFVFQSGGLGHRSDYTDGTVVDLQWYVDDDEVLQIDFADGGHESVTLLSRAGDVVNVVVRGDQASGEPVTAQYFGFDNGFAVADMAGSYSSADEPGEYKVFLPDGSGYDLDVRTGVQTDVFTWDIDADGALVMVDVDDGERAVVRRLEGSTDTSLHLLVTETSGSGEVAELDVIRVLRTDEILTGPVQDGSASLALAGASYAVTDPDDLALVTFGVDGVFSEVAQFQGDDGTWELREESGAWTVLEGDVVRIEFADEDEPDDAVVVEGLGQDFMVVETADDAGQSERTEVTRIVPIEAALVPGSYSILAEDGTTSDETVELLSDRTGVHREAEGATEDRFTWRVDASGRLVVEEHSDNAFDTRTMTFYMLAGSSGDLMSFVVVRRTNGELDGDQSSADGTPDALSIITLLRTR